MAYNLSAQDPKLVQTVGSFTNLAVGMVTMASGTGTVTIPGLSVIEGIVGSVQGTTGAAETVIVISTAANVAVLETVDESGNKAGTSVVMYIAWGKAKN